MHPRLYVITVVQPCVVIFYFVLLQRRKIQLTIQRVQTKPCPCTLFFQMEHERVTDRQHFSQLQLRTVTQQWHRDHEQLLARALVTLEEARHAHQEELEHHKDRQHQQDICSQLREKVRVLWTPTLWGAFSVSVLWDRTFQCWQFCHSSVPSSCV